MWEFSLNLKTENFELAKYFHNALFSYANSLGGMVTSHEENGFISVLVAVPQSNCEQIKSILLCTITEVICTKFKSDFLNKSLI